MTMGTATFFPCLLLPKKSRCPLIPIFPLARKKAGVLIPLFSVYSKNSFGAGDANDLMQVVDWAQKTSNSIIQLLPINDLGALFCPYDALSSFALEPLYISLRDLPLPKDKSIKRQIENLRKALPQGNSYVDYALKKEKMRLLWEIFLMENPQGSLEFGRFKNDNAYWLEDFSLFKALKAEFNDSAWYDWPLEFKNRDKDALDKFRKTHSREIDFNGWVQWQLYQQFKRVKDYAAGKGVFLKGDLPILVCRDSSDVWSHAEFFKLGFAAGAPPDMYCAKGQRWGMPTYNWPEIAASGYKYLKERLKYAGNFYDILRIDHVVGLFRIWSIPYAEPVENQGLNGFFDPVNEAEWEAHGKRILEVMLTATNMFLCAEDLGVIPKSCTATLKALKIPGSDVQRWAKDWDLKHDFRPPQEYRQLSISMLSTHDTTNWPAWWENEAGTVDEDLFRRKCVEAGVDFDRVKPELFDLERSSHARLRWKEELVSVDKFLFILRKKKEEALILVSLYENTYGEKEKLWKLLGLAGAMREKCDKEIFRAVLKLTLDASSFFCINTIIDLLYLDDVWQADAYQYRINTPGTISERNWSLKLPLSLEELLKHPVNKQIRKMVVDSGRV